MICQLARPPTFHGSVVHMHHTLFARQTTDSWLLMCAPLLLPWCSNIVEFLGYGKWEFAADPLGKTVRPSLFIVEVGITSAGHQSCHAWLFTARVACHPWHGCWSAWRQQTAMPGQQQCRVTSSWLCHEMFWQKRLRPVLLLQPPLSDHVYHNGATQSAGAGGRWVSEDIGAPPAAQHEQRAAVSGSRCCAMAPAGA
jgi:hypothetical protein